MRVSSASPAGCRNVVVALEAVEVEQLEQQRPLERGVADADLEVGQQAAPVAEAGERVVQRLVGELLGGELAAR